jgi:heme o synthase
MVLSAQTFKAYCELTKPRIMSLVLVTASIGYFLGGQGIRSYLQLLLMLTGTAFCCGGAGVLNHYLERDADLRMKRTRGRPLPAGIVAPADALAFGIVLVILGTVLLVWKVNLLTGFLALLTAFLYALVYTPLKRVTWLNTFVGAIPGAIPPMGGWAAATGGLEVGAWILFLILFVWQHPHFYSIAWMYKEDYERGGFKMLPVVEPDGKSTFRQIVIYSVLLISSRSFQR